MVEKCQRCGSVLIPERVKLGYCRPCGKIISREEYQQSVIDIMD